ncbi:FAD-dependent oxidoreductase [Halieaceae bacterium IMCC14734]|uniref:FAD-dependent oxidoreductase n=1 Tax=Candidatus Litorirhabdus singularis TaxID=2518993 RepID=A0ABT3TAJ0_9GAMM|nr:FAD-dependent oxidoreductase [Candidatus Litorirhabdus singularis]MCX2979311.1 FAD-dependent oxidoreductase [Candidatus Litorirhabdus singularis]
MSSKVSPSRPLRRESVESWHLETDVLIVGLGAAGASAAITARDAGAEVVVVEAASAGGGTTALAGGQIYFGGGTPTQKACGIEDRLEDMFQYLMLASGPSADEARVREYVDNNLAHFDWLVEQGLEFKPEYVKAKLNNTHGDEGLIYSGNETCYPYDEQARPAPRGHKGKAKGEGGGALLMDTLIASAERKGAWVLYEARALTSIVDEQGRVVGLVVRIDGEERCIHARGGVVLCAGGFIMNREMLAQHAPRLLLSNFPLGNPNDTGMGIRIGQGAGGCAINMHEGFVSLPFYPPSCMVEGILVNGKGQRVVAEDVYHGRLGEEMFAAPDEKFYMVIDSRNFEAMEKPPLGGYSVAAVGETIEELEAELALPPGMLAHTLAFFNEHAAAGQDPLFHKRPPYLKPLDQPPYAAFDFSMGGGAWFPAFTFGGLDTSLDGEVLNAEGEAIAGLFAAGRTTCGLPRWGAGYASGMSIGDATYFGRKAGAAAAGC